jgi:hypothetical protein
VHRWQSFFKCFPDGKRGLADVYITSITSGERAPLADGRGIKARFDHGNRIYVFKDKPNLHHVTGFAVVTGTVEA